MSEKFLDAGGLICPLPVLKARKVLLAMAEGEVLRVEFTDPAAAKDFKIFCAEQGYTLKSVAEVSAEPYLGTVLIQR